MNKSLNEILINNIKKDGKIVPLSENIDMENTEKILMDMIEQKKKTSLAYEISEVQPMIAPVGVVFVSNYDYAQEKMTIGKVKIEAQTSKIKTDITQEALDDLAQFGKDFELIEKFVRRASDNDENMKFVQFLNTKSTAMPDLNMTAYDSTNSENSLFILLKRITEIVSEINKSNYMTFSSYCVVPAKFASIPLGQGFNNVSEENELFLGAYKKVRFYLNPDVNDEQIYVGLCSKIESGVSSIIFSPYQYLISKAQDPEAGIEKYFVFNRYQITENPLNQTKMYKFKIKIN